MPPACLFNSAAAWCLWLQSAGLLKMKQAQKKGKGKK
jgi:hypothetical protein